MPVPDWALSYRRKVMGSVNSVDKDKAIEAAISKLDKQFGRGAVMKLGDTEMATNLPVVPTGSLGLDVGLGVGGLPRGGG